MYSTTYFTVKLLFRRYLSLVLPLHAIFSSDLTRVRRERGKERETENESKNEGDEEKTISSSTSDLPSPKPFHDPTKDVPQKWHAF